MKKTIQYKEDNFIQIHIFGHSDVAGGMLFFFSNEHSENNDDDNE